MRIPTRDPTETSVKGPLLLAQSLLSFSPHLPRIMSNETSPFLTPDRLGPLSIGSSLNVAFFTLEILQAINYFRSIARPRDSLFIKLVVTVNLFADLVGTAACCATTYLYTVAYWGDVEALKERYTPLTVIVFTVGIATAMSQFFMISRYWQMTKHHVVLALLLLILLGAVTGILGSGVLMSFSLNGESMLWDIFIFLALLASAAGNVLISLLLFWQLCERNDTPVTKNFLTRITCVLVEAGALTAVVTIIGSVVSLGRTRDTMVWIIFAFIQARVYSCTMLFVLNGRPESASALTGNAVETAHIGVSLPKGPRDMGMMVLAARPVIDDADAFRLTKKKLELRAHEVDSDSDSDVSRNLNDELREMDEEHHDDSRRPSFSSSRRGSFSSSRRGSFSSSRRPSFSSAGGKSDAPDSPSEYPTSPEPEA
ncbi:hypothetical protein B0H13DRAFT_2119871 [Mycena leptocephala]|nr:hypothetical protein B0H13DRAFT_2119871 [Mycena leptocephala]